MVEVGARAIGARVLRAEDPRILTGRGRYVDDVVLPGMLHGRIPAQHRPARTAVLRRRLRCSRDARRHISAGMTSSTTVRR